MDENKKTDSTNPKLKLDKGKLKDLSLRSGVHAGHITIKPPIHDANLEDY